MVNKTETGAHSDPIGHSATFSILPKEKILSNRQRKTETKIYSHASSTKDASCFELNANDKLTMAILANCGLAAKVFVMFTILL